MIWQHIARISYRSSFGFTPVETSQFHYSIWMLHYYCCCFAAKKPFASICTSCVHYVMLGMYQRLFIGQASIGGLTGIRISRRKSNIIYHIRPDSKTNVRMSDEMSMPYHGILTSLILLSVNSSI